MKRPWHICAVAAAAVIVAALGAACTSTGLDTMVRRGDVRVCSTGDYRPFTYRDAAGHWSGMDIEMAQDLATRLDVELNVVPTTWGTMMKDLGNRCDIAMSGISVTPDRAQHALYSIPYVRDGKAAIVRCADRAKYRTLAQIDRPGVRVVENPGGTNADFDKANIHHATIRTYPDNNTIFGQVADNAADVMITDASEIRWQTKENPQLCAESVDHPFTVAQKAYLLPRSELALQQWVDDWLNIAENDGTYAAISKKWLGG